MHLQQEIDNNRLRIKAYRAGEIRINEQHYQQTLLLRADQLQQLDELTEFAQLDFAQLQNAATPLPEVLLIGCGEKFQLMPLTLQRQLEAAGIATEIMATREACHTWEVLSYEQRDVVALLFL